MKLFFFFLHAFTVFLFFACDSSSDPSGGPNDPKDEEQVILASVKVMTYNIHHCNPPSTPGVIDIDAIVRVIRAENPDLVALQEVDVNTERSGPYDQAAEIAQKLGMYHFFGKAIDYQGGAYGVAILSKYRLYATTMQRLPMETGGEARVMAVASLKLPDSTAIRFATTHLDAQSDPANRIAQMERIVGIAEDELLPFIIGGDFNAEPGSDEIDLLDAHFERTCRLCAPTIPATNPARAIDFIAFHHPENKFEAATHNVVDERSASDHRPVTAVIDLLE